MIKSKQRHTAPSQRRTSIAAFSVYTIFAVFYLWIAFCIPYTHDDWDWGLPIGLEQLLTANLNARYAGNFFVVVMTRSQLLKTLIMGAGFFLIPYILSSLADRMRKNRSAGKKLRDFFVCNVLLLSMDRWIWRQTYGWVSGFANFVICGIFMLLILMVCLPVFGEEFPEKDHFSGKSIYLLFLGVVSQLFLENVAIFLFGFVLVTAVVYRKRTKKFSVHLFFLWLGTALGLGIMFSSSLYRTLWSSGTAVYGYRKLFINANAGLGQMLLNCLRQGALLPYRIGENNLILSILIPVLLGLNLWYQKEKTLLHRLLLGANCIWIGYVSINHFSGILSNPLLLSVVNSAYWLLCAVEIWVIFRKKKSKCILSLVFWASSIAVLLPLIVTSEIGPRLFFTANLFSMLLALMLLDTLSTLAAAKLRRSGMIVCICVAVILTACHGKIYYDILRCQTQRQGLIAHATQAEQIDLPCFPHQEYLWHPEPDAEHWLIAFKDYYDIPQETDVRFVP